MFTFKTTSDSVINSLTKDNKITVVYDKTNPYSFISVFILYEYFKSEDMLDSVVLHATDSNRKDSGFPSLATLKTVKDKSVLIFIDCDVTAEILTYYAMHVSKMFVIDDYQSSHCIAFEKYGKSLLRMKHKKAVSFISTPKACSPITIWRTITNDTIPNCLYKIQDLYKHDKNQSRFSDYDLVTLTGIGNNFNDLEEFLKDENLEILELYKKFYSVVSYVTVSAINTVYKNSIAVTLTDYKGICINCSQVETKGVFHVLLSNEKIDFVICYEHSHDFIKCFIKTNKPTVDLLKLFSKHNPIGNKNDIHFSTYKPITKIVNK